MAIAVEPQTANLQPTANALCHLMSEQGLLAYRRVSYEDPAVAITGRGETRCQALARYLSRLHQ